MIRNILKAQSALGIEPVALYLENLMYLSTLLYFVLRGDDFTNYGENFFLLLQNVIITGLMWHYAKKSVGHIALVLAAFAAFVAAAWQGLLPESLLIALPMLLMLFSRVPQIAANFRNGHTGIQSRTTFTLNTLGGAARVFTTLAKTESDPGALALIFAGFALNFTLAAQCFAFAKKTKQVLAADKKKN